MAAMVAICPPARELAKPMAEPLLAMPLPAPLEMRSMAVLAP